MLDFISEAVPLFTIRLTQILTLYWEAMPLLRLFQGCSSTHFCRFWTPDSYYADLSPFGEKEDEVHCSVYDPSKHIKLCSYELVRLLCFSENSSGCSFSFSCNTMSVLKILAIYNWVWKTAFTELSSGTPEQYMPLPVFLLGACVLLLCRVEATDFMVGCTMLSLWTRTTRTTKLALKS